METHLHQKFYINMEQFRQKNLLNAVTIALSGGQDSLCLMKLIQDFKRYHYPSLKIDYVYIDHQWKKDSKIQTKHLVNIINSTHEKIYIYQIRSIPSSELKARKFRYQLLTHHSIVFKNSIIITAHTETDKIETFWQQIMRGTTINGATSLTSQRILEKHIKLWRPLINFTRNEINWFCRKFYLPVWSDSTNYSYHISRNRLRNELIPYLKQYFQYNIEKQINQFLQYSNADNEYIKQNAIKLYLISRHPKSLAINYNILKQQHAALQVRTLQLFVYHNLNQLLSKDILYKLIDQIQNIFHHKKIVTLKSIKIAIFNYWLYIY